MNVVPRHAAIAAGLAKYFTGKPCKHGHISERNAGSGTCIACKTEWVLKNPEKQAMSLRKHRATHGERIKQRQKQIRDSNIEHYRAYSRDWKRENAAAMSEARKRYRNKNRDFVRGINARYSRSNTGLINAKTAARRAQKLLATPLWSQRCEILQLYKESARLTTETGIAHHVDHIVPLNSAIVCGLHVIANLRIITGAENTSKGNRLWPGMP